MKIFLALFCITSATLFFFSCEKEECVTLPDDLTEQEENEEKEVTQTDIFRNGLIGEWEWVKSIGGFFGTDLATPEIIGYTRSISFNDDGTYTKKKDGVYDSSGIYEVVLDSMYEHVGNYFKPIIVLELLTIYETGEYAPYPRYYRAHDLELSGDSLLISNYKITEGFDISYVRK